MDTLVLAAAVAWTAHILPGKAVAAEEGTCASCASPAFGVAAAVPQAGRQVVVRVAIAAVEGSPGASDVCA